MQKPEPGRDCPLCPRLVEYRHAQRKLHPDWFNAPVPAFGGDNARLLIVGLAPGVQGANRTGRPFTGDFAGDLLYETLLKFGFAEGHYRADPHDGLKLKDAIITNAVRCVPPENKPTGVEARSCRPFLVEEMAAMPNLKGVPALGQLAHTAVVAALQQKQAALKFGHGAVHPLPGSRFLADSYHCSRYNTNTGVLTPDMFREVFSNLRASFGAIA